MAFTSASLVVCVISGRTRFGGVNGVRTCAVTSFLHRRRIKRHAAGQRVIQRRPEAIHVRQKSLRFAVDFFRRDVIRRAVHHGAVFLLRIGLAREAEIHQLRFVVVVEKDVARLDVAMDQIVLERQVERGGDLDADVQHRQFVHANLLFDARVEAAAVGQFHDEIAQAFPFVERVNVDDVRVVEPGAGAGFAVKTFQCGGILEQIPFSSASPPRAVPAPCPSRDTPCRCRPTPRNCAVQTAAATSAS